VGKDTQQKVPSGLKREFSSGGVVFKKESGHVLWLVTRSRASSLYPKSIWRLPKGKIDEGESSPDAAIREVSEEGGVKAKIIDKIETTKYFFTSREGKGKIFKFVTFYLMEWVKNIPGGFGEETAEISWLVLDEAVKKLEYSSERQILKKAKEILSSLV